MGTDRFASRHDRERPPRSEEDEGRETGRLQPVQRKTENEIASQYPPGHLVQGKSTFDVGRLFPASDFFNNAFCQELFESLFDHGNADIRTLQCNIRL